MHDISTWNVLIVDDEPDNIGVLELVFNFHGARVRVADSGKSCLSLLEEEVPTLLLMDIQMPVMSGYELLRHIRQNIQWNGIPVIAVTAHAMQGDEEKVMNAGFDGYIAKPINAMTLAQEIQSILQNIGRLNGH